MRRLAPEYFILSILLAAGIAYLVNIFYFDWVDNHNIAGDEVFKGAVVGFESLFVAIFTAPIFIQLDKEQKTVAQAIKDKDLEAFLDEAGNRQSPLIYTFTAFGLIAVNATLQFFHIEGVDGWLIGMVAFISLLAFIFLVDLDRPIGGIYGIAKVPRGWDEKLKERQQQLQDIDF